MSILGFRGDEAHKAPLGNRLPVHLSSMIWEAKKHNDNTVRRHLNQLVGTLRLIPILAFLAALVTSLAKSVSNGIKRLIAKIETLAPRPYFFNGQVQNLTGYHLASDEDILVYRAKAKEEEKARDERDKEYKQRCIADMLKDVDVTKAFETKSTDLPTKMALGSTAASEGSISKPRPAATAEFGSSALVKAAVTKIETTDAANDPALKTIVDQARTLVTAYDRKQTFEKKVDKLFDEVVRQKKQLDKKAVKKGSKKGKRK